MKQSQTRRTLTEAQKRVLRELDDDTYEFPEGRLVATYEILERLGYAVSKLDVASRNYANRMVYYRTSYKRTPAGKQLAEALE